METNTPAGSIPAEIVIPEVMRDKISTVDRETMLAPAEADALRVGFARYFSDLQRWQTVAAAISVTDESQTREMKAARDARLALREIRCNVEAMRKRLKEDSLRRGKAIDGYANILKAMIEPTEQRLLEQEEFAARAQAARTAAIVEERKRILATFRVDPFIYNLAAMTETQFLDTVAGLEATRLAAIEEARKAEQARIDAENARAEEARQAVIRRQAEEAERARLQEIAQAERRSREAAEKALRDQQAAAAKELEAQRQALAKEAREAASKAEFAALQERLAAKAELEAHRDAALKEAAAQAAEAKRQEAERLEAYRKEVAEQLARDEAARLEAAAKIPVCRNAEVATPPAGLTPEQRDADRARDMAARLRSLADSVPEFETEDGQSAQIEAIRVLANTAQAMDALAT